MSNGANYIPHAYMVIAPYNFRDEELFETKKALDECNTVVTITSTTKLEVPGMLGGKATPEALIEEMECRNCDALILVGGSGAKVYFNNEVLFEIIRDARTHDKIIAAICISPSILANAGILKGVKATVSPSEKDNIENKGAIYVNKGVVRDGKIITAQGPKNSKEFGQAICQALHEIHRK